MRASHANLSNDYRKYLHEDFLANEEHYWHVRETLLKEYQGRWVAIHKGQVVANSQDVWEITEAVGKLGCHAYIAKVGGGGRGFQSQTAGICL